MSGSVLYTGSLLLCYFKIFQFRYSLETVSWLGRSTIWKILVFYILLHSLSAVPWVLLLGFVSLAWRLVCTGKYIALSVHSKLAWWKMVWAAGIKVSCWERLYLPFFSLPLILRQFIHVFALKRTHRLVSGLEAFHVETGGFLLTPSCSCIIQSPVVSARGTSTGPPAETFMWS